MGLMGGLHLFAQQGQVATVCGFRLDGHKHHGRALDPDRMVRRLGELREGVKILDKFQFDDRSSDHRETGAQPYEDCQLLQLTDVLVSGFRTVLSKATNPVQAELASPLRELVPRSHRGPARMENSWRFGGFCIGECWLDQGEWQFGVHRRVLIGSKNFLLYLILRRPYKASELRCHDPFCSALTTELLQFYYSLIRCGPLHKRVRNFVDLTL